ncbi:MAG: hypothetical protein SFU91_07670 [Chloroherpetonaceae bacterium]|nr:hypothetical protein [Chloroherpetonaceae bacterium]
MRKNTFGRWMLPPSSVGWGATPWYRYYFSGQENEGEGKIWNFRARLYNTDFNRFYALNSKG